MNTPDFPRYYRCNSADAMRGVQGLNEFFYNKENYVYHLVQPYQIVAFSNTSIVHTAERSLDKSVEGIGIELDNDGIPQSLLKGNRLQANLMFNPSSNIPYEGFQLPESIELEVFHYLHNANQHQMN